MQDSVKKATETSGELRYRIAFYIEKVKRRRIMVAAISDRLKNDFGITNSTFYRDASTRTNDPRKVPYENMKAYCRVFSDLLGENITMSDLDPEEK